MQGQPMQGQPMPGQPMPGQPMQGQPMPGQPMQGQPMPVGAVMHQVRQQVPGQLQQPGQGPPGAFPVHGQRPMLIQQGNSYYQFGLTKLRFNGKYVKYCDQQK